MDMWPLKVIVLLLYCYGSSAMNKEKPYFISRNFNTVLHWNKVDIPGVRYSVRYNRYGEPYESKMECQNITAVSCDLTAETPSIYGVQYHADVYADGRLLGGTGRFLPLRDTVLGPPILSVTATVSSLKVTVALPLGPDKKTSIVDIFNRTSFHYHEPLTLYTLNITHPSWAAKVHTNATGEFIMNNLESGIKYCGFMTYMPAKERHRAASEQASFCETLPDDPWPMLIWFLLSGCLLFGCVLVLVVLCRRYMGEKSQLPDSLNLPRSSIPPALLHLPEDIISKPDHYPVVPSHCGFKTFDPQVGSKGTSAGTDSYSPQVCPYMAQPWHCDTYIGQQSPPPDHSNNSTQFSTNYSMVVVQMANEGVEGSHPTSRKQSEDIDPQWTSEFKDLKPSWDQGGAGQVLVSRGAPPEHVEPLERDLTGHPLVLPTLRDANGLLKLSTLLLQTGEQSAMASLALPTDPEGMRLLSDLNSGEGVPLLSDLFTMGESEWSDPDPGKEVGTTYIPIPVSLYSNHSATLSLPPTTLPDSDTSSMGLSSGYKQNWVPSNLLGLTLEDRCELEITIPQQAWTDPKEEEEEEEEEEREGIFLSGWVIQSQG